MKHYYKKKIFWEAWFEVNFSRLLGLPKYQYAWWLARLNLIRKGKINN